MGPRRRPAGVSLGVMPYRASELKAPQGPHRGVPRWLLPGLALLVLAGVVVRGARAPAPRAVEPRVPLPVVPCDRVEVLAERADGSRDVLCGVVRETLPGEGAAAVAEERFASRVVSATPVASGWVFVLEDGMVAHSDSFLGRLKALGRVPCIDRSRRALARSAGRAVVLGLDGRLWTSGDEGVRPLSGPPGRVISVVFASATRGAAVTDTGMLASTDDGGLRWTPVGLGGEVAWEVGLGRDGDIEVATTAGTKILSEGALRSGGLCRGETVDRSTTRVGSAATDRASRASVRAQEVFRAAFLFDRCEPSPPAGRPWSDRRPLPEIRGFRCALDRGAGPRAAPPPMLPPNGHPATRIPLRLATGSGRVQARISEEFGMSEAMRVGWSGSDASGRFTTWSGTLAIPTDPDGRPDLWRSGRVQVHATSRAGLLASGASGSLQWIHSHQRPVGPLFGRWPCQLERPSVTPSARCLGREPSEVAAALPNGGAAWAEWGTIDRRTVATGIEFAPDGEVRFRRALMVDASHPIGLGRWDGVVGIVTWSSLSGRETTFHPLDGSSAHNVPHFPEEVGRGCMMPAGARSRTWATVWHLDAPQHPTPATIAGGVPFASATRYELEVGGASGSSCLRSVTLREDGDPAVATTLTAVAADRFEGTRGDQGVERVSCVAIGYAGSIP